MRTYQRVVVFTKVPLVGYFRYKDIFQIFPADFKDMPDNPYKRHHPNILEYWFTDEDKIVNETEFESLRDLYTLTATTVTKQDTIISLLNAFTNNLFFKYSSSEGVWAMPIIIDPKTNAISEQINSSSAQWCSDHFYFPTLADQLQIHAFTDVKLNYVATMPHLLFYTYNPSLDNDTYKVITFPDTMHQILDVYYGLNIETKLIVDAAIGYNISAIELWSQKRTLALLASFTALETMVNLEYRDVKAETCQSCNQQKFSIALKFRLYLLKYIGESPENKKKFNAYYNLRSKIVHTGMRLKSETLFAEYPKEELNQEYLTRIEILQVGKLAIANWLIKNSVSSH